jgi:transposase
MDKTFIYTLSDPITNEIRYVGKANNLKKRLSTHLTPSNLIKPSHKNNWIKSLLVKNLKPLIKIVDEVLISEWEFWEIYWISQFKTWGFKLTNLTNGGDYVINEIKFGSDNNNFNHKIDDLDILKLIDDGLSQKEIAFKLKTNIALIKRRMLKFNINFKKRRGERITQGNTHNFRHDITNEKVMELYNKGLSVNKISKILNADCSTIKKRIIK